MRRNASVGVWHWWLCVFLAALYAGVARAAVAADGRVVVVNPAIRIPPNSSSDVAIVKVKVEGLSSEQMRSSAEPRLGDTTRPAPAGTVAFRVLRSEITDPTCRLWWFAVTVEGLPSGQSQKRTARFQFEGIDSEIEYALSNLDTGASNWVVLPPPDPWVMTSWLPRTQCAAIGLVPGDAPATGLHIQQSTVVEQTTRKLLGLDHLRLCRDPLGARCGEGRFDLPPHYSGPPLYFCVDDTFHGHGNYRGVASLSSAEKPEAQAVALDIYSSSFGAKLVGFFLILSGVLGAWVTKVFAINRMIRDQELLPATMLRARVETLSRYLTDLPADYQRELNPIKDRINGLLTDLEPDNLYAHNFIHPANPNPVAQSVNDAAYKRFLTETDAIVNLLTVLLEEGIKRVVRIASNPPAPPPDAVLEALRQIADLLKQSPLPNEAMARAAISQQIVDGLAHKIPIAAGAAPPPVPAATAVSFDKINLEIAHLSLLLWGVTASLTALVGLVVLILNNAGFGIPVDYAYCLFWGFGIPTAIQQLTGGSATTALGISMAKL